MHGQSGNRPCSYTGWNAVMKPKKEEEKYSVFLFIIGEKGT